MDTDQYMQKFQNKEFDNSIHTLYILIGDKHRLVMLYADDCTNK